MNSFLGGCAVILPRRFAPTEQPDIVQIGMFRRVQTGAARIIRAHKVVRGAVAAALAVREDFHIHGTSSISGESCGGGVSVSLNSRSRLTRATSTSIVSARLLWIFTHRAS